jgi:hypothetical protein
MVSVTTLSRQRMAITIPQPWAQLSVMGLRNSERRSFPFPRRYMGKPIVVHASASPMISPPVRKSIESILHGIDSGSVGVASILGEVHPMQYAGIRDVLVRALDAPETFPLAAGIGQVLVMSTTDAAIDAGVPSSRRHVWVLDKYQAHAWTTPQPAVGRAGVWQWGYAT